MATEAYQVDHQGEADDRDDPIPEVRVRRRLAVEHAHRVFPGCSRDSHGVTHLPPEYPDALGRHRGGEFSPPRP